MLRKLIGFMVMHALNFAVALAISLIAFLFLTHYDNFGAAGPYMGMFIFFLVVPIVAISLTVSLACLQFAGLHLWKAWEWRNSKKMGWSIIGALIALFLPLSLITIYGHGSELWAWGWFVPSLMALMMLLWSLPMVLVLIWQSENSKYKKNQ